MGNLLFNKIIMPYYQFKIRVKKKTLQHIKMLKNPKIIKMKKAVKEFDKYINQKALKISKKELNKTILKNIKILAFKN